MFDQNTWPKAETDAYYDTAKRYLDREAVLSTAKQEGWEEGREESRIKGLEQGLEQGLEKGPRPRSAANKNRNG